MSRHAGDELVETSYVSSLLKVLRRVLQWMLLRTFFFSEAYEVVHPSKTLPYVRIQ